MCVIFGFDTKQVIKSNCELSSSDKTTSSDVYGAVKRWVGKQKFKIAGESFIPGFEGSLIDFYWIEDFYWLPNIIKSEMEDKRASTYNWNHLRKWQKRIFLEYRRTTFQVLWRWCINIAFRDPTEKLFAAISNFPIESPSALVSQTGQCWNYFSRPDTIARFMAQHPSSSKISTSFLPETFQFETETAKV